MALLNARPSPHPGDEHLRDASPRSRALADRLIEQLEAERAAHSALTLTDVVDALEDAKLFFADARDHDF